MEALAAETQALTALEAQLRTELKELRARREASETTLSERSAELEKGKRREAELSEQESALVEEDAATAAELGELESSYAGQRIAKAWYASKLPPASFAHAVVSATPVKWASVVTGSRAASATLESALAADGARLRLLEKLWANLGDTAAIVSGAAVLPGVEAVRVAAEAAGYADPSDEQLSTLRRALEVDLGRLRWDDAQLQTRRAKLSFDALSSGRGSLGSSPSLAVPRSPSLSASMLLRSPTSSTKSPGVSAATSGIGARALAVSRSTNRLTTGGVSVRGGGGSASGRAGQSFATVYASIVPALKQLKASGDVGGGGGSSIAHRIAGAKSLAQAALDPQTRDAILRADGPQLLRSAVEEEEAGAAAARRGVNVADMDTDPPAIGLLRLEVDIALERLGQAEG